MNNAFQTHLLYTGTYNQQFYGMSQNKDCNIRKQSKAEIFNLHNWITGIQKLALVKSEQNCVCEAASWFSQNFSVKQCKCSLVQWNVVLTNVGVTKYSVKQIFFYNLLHIFM
jgi:hypothetical protein